MRTHFFVTLISLIASAKVYAQASEFGSMDHAASAPAINNGFTNEAAMAIRQPNNLTIPSVSYSSNITFNEAPAVFQQGDSVVYGIPVSAPSLYENPPQPAIRHGGIVQCPPGVSNGMNDEGIFCQEYRNILPKNRSSNSFEIVQPVSRRPGAKVPIHAVDCSFLMKSTERARSQMGPVALSNLEACERQFDLAHPEGDGLLSDESLPKKPSKDESQFNQYDRDLTIATGELPILQSPNEEKSPDSISDEIAESKTDPNEIPEAATLLSLPSDSAR